MVIIIFHVLKRLVQITKHKVQFNEMTFKIKMRIGGEKANPRY
jgi:hypothetical protein